jgi:hypothetical protein
MRISAMRSATRGTRDARGAMKMRAFSTALCLMLLVASSSALACSCLRTDSDESRFRQAKHVFTARITGATEVKDGQGARIEAKFSVSEVFKGQPHKLEQLWSHIPFGHDSNSCAVVFSVGEHYVFLVDDDGLVDYCSGSKRYNPALEKSAVEALRALASAKAR